MHVDGDCRKISCCGSEAGNFSSFVYSLVSGASYSNEETTFVVDCPPQMNCSGPTITIVIPPGVINFQPEDQDPNPKPPGDPTDPEPGIYRFNCGTNTLVITLGPGQVFSGAQIIQIINFLASCNADDQVDDLLRPIPPSIIFTNDVVYAACPAGALLTAPGALPSWVTVEVNATGNRLAGRPGTFTGGSVVLATAAAQAALNQFLTDAIGSGDLVCTCYSTSAGLPGGTVGDPYSTNLVTATGMPGIHTISGGSLPPGMTLNSATGVVSGTPTQAGVFIFQVRFTPF